MQVQQRWEGDESCISFCLPLECFGWQKCLGMVWRGLKLPYQREEVEAPYSFSCWLESPQCLEQKTGGLFSPLPRPDLRAQPPEHLTPDPQIFTQYLHPRDREGSQTSGDLSWACLVFQSPWSHAVKVSSFPAKPYSSMLN